MVFLAKIDGKTLPKEKLSRTSFRHEFIYIKGEVMTHITIRPDIIFICGICGEKLDALNKDEMSAEFKNHINIYPCKKCLLVELAKLEMENEKLRKIIKIFEIQIIAARRANSLGLCKRALIHAVDDINKIKILEK